MSTEHFLARFVVFPLGSISTQYSMIATSLEREIDAETVRIVRAPSDHFSVREIAKHVSHVVFSNRHILLNLRPTIFPSLQPASSDSILEPCP